MKKITAGVLAFSIIAILGIGLIAAFPFGNFNLNKDLTEEEKTEMQEFNDAIQQAIEDGDFETWKSLMESQLTEENFNALIERYNQMSEDKEANEEIREQIREAMQSGDYETAEQLREQMGKNTMGFERGKNFEMREEPPFGCQNPEIESDSE
jgi:DNA-binding FadR family transcriptional regulator